MSSNIDELKPPGSSPPKSPYTGWQAASARYFKFADYMVIIGSAALLVMHGVAIRYKIELDFG